MIEHILVAVDGSDHSDRAIDFAAELGVKFDAELTLLNVVSHSAIVPMSMGIYAELEQIYLTNRDTLEEAGGEIITAAEERATAAGVEDVERAVAFGSPAQAIVETAREIDADVIVMGRRGLGDLGGLLLGSISHKVGHLADRTVVTVK
jgi:nucleotide-binding universal stress UspA family protein